MTNSTRFLMAVGVMVGYLLEAVLKSFLPGFPFNELILGQGAIATGYLAVRTITGMQEERLGCDKDPH